MIIHTKIKILLVTLFPLIGAHLSAQNNLRGLIVDSLTNNPIPFVSIGIEGTNKGTISNEKGYFILKQDSSKPFFLNFYALGYAPRKIAIQNEQEITVRLASVGYKLNETTIKANEGEKVFIKALQKLQSTPKFLYQSDAFFRLITKTDDTCTEMIENFYTTWLGNTGIKYWEMEHGRYALPKNYVEKGLFKSLDFSQIIRYADILNENTTDKINYLPFVFDKRYLKYLWFNIDMRIEGKDDTIIKIDFKPKKKFANKIATSGSIFISTKTFEVLRVIQKWDRWDENPLIHSTDNNIGVKNLKAEFDITFNKNSKQELLIKNVILKIGYDMFDNRTMKIIHKINTSSDLLFYNYSNQQIEKNIEVEDDELSIDYNDIKHRIYIKQYWDNNAVLEETPYEKSIREDFEKTGSFGNIFNNANDTLEIINNNYLMWQKDKRLHLDDLKYNSSTIYDPHKIEIRYEGTKIGGMLGELFFAWNCYNDSFYYVVLPLLDLNLSWILPSEISSSPTGFIYQKYFDLLEIHKRILVKKLDSISLQCMNKKLIMNLYKLEKEEFYTESRKMIFECWGGDESSRMRGSYIWEKLIENRLK